jgi:DNA polymerase III epsilon subunit family exonuclease
LDVFHSLVNPGRPISPGAYAVNHISADMVKDAPYFSEVAQPFLDFIKDTVLVGHNARFDMSFLATQLGGLNLPRPENHVVDTLNLARRFYRFPGNSLGTVARQLGIKPEDEHRALADVKTTRAVFEVFLKDFQSRGVESLEDLLRLQGNPVSYPRPQEIILPPALEEAIKSKRKISLKYLSSVSEETVRVVDPIKVGVFTDYIYLVAYCHLRKAKRTFRLDRIVEMHLVE